MSFQIRQPPIGNSTYEKGRLGALGWKKPRSRRTANMAIDEFDEFDEFDDDAEITTPNSVRESGIPFASQSVLLKSGSSVFARSREISDGPTTPIRKGGSELSQLQFDFIRENDEEVDIGARTAGLQRAEDGSAQKKPAKLADSSPSQKLISDENQLTSEAMAKTLSPPRMGALRFVDSLNQHKDMEFDPSDRDLPEKKSTNPATLKAYEKHKFGHEEPRQNIEVVERPRVPQKNYVPTPKRLSPLRNEVLPSSSIKSTASSMLEEIRNSGALKPRTAEEIQDQIHSSMLRLEQSILKPGSESDSSLDSSEIQDDSEDEDLLNELDKFIPAQFSGGAVDEDRVPESMERDERNVFHDTPTGISNLSRVDLAALQSTGSPPSRTKKNRTRRTGKLSGKYARKKIKDNKQQTANKKYGSWLAEQWDKLKSLVDLSVPNNIIASSVLVMRELKCGSKQELSQRVRFLERTKK